VNALDVFLTKQAHTRFEPAARRKQRSLLIETQGSLTHASLFREASYPEISAFFVGLFDSSHCRDNLTVFGE
jgi:hypothetical protein